MRGNYGACTVLGMAEGGRDLIGEWRAAMQSVLAATASVTGRAQLPRQLLVPLQKQAELVQEVLERERDLMSHAFAPVDAVFDLLEQSGVALRKQAESLSESARALEQAAELVRAQAELYERTIRTLRRPTELARTAAGVKRRPARGRR
jgi:hypothetical protein